MVQLREFKIVTLILFLLVLKPVFCEDYEFPSNYKNSLEDLLSTNQPSRAILAIQFLEKFPTIELTHAVSESLQVLSIEMARKGVFTEEFSDAFAKLSDYLKKYGSKEDVRVINDVIMRVKRVKSIRSQSRANPITDSDLSHQFNPTLNILLETQTLLDVRIVDNSNELPSFLKWERDKSRIEKEEIEKVSKSNNVEEARGALDIFENRLREKLVGQDRLVKTAKNVHFMDLLFDYQRSAPELFYLMGLPGNGKDTFVEAISYALYGEEKMEDYLFKFNVKNSEEFWSLLGSGKGFVGSTELPKFLSYVAKISNGKYIVSEERTSSSEKRAFLELNPSWDGKQGRPGLIFINEFHNLPKDVKDAIKEAVEYGTFEIKNPGPTENAANKIQLNFTFVIASNEGMELLEPRESNGQRIGEPLSYEDIHRNWLRYVNNEQALVDSILKTNGGTNTASGRSEKQAGVSIEFVNRFLGRLFLMEPLSPELLQRIIKNHIKEWSKKFAKVNAGEGLFQIEVSKELVNFIQSFDYVASENARPIKSKLKRILLEQIAEALYMGKIPLDDPKQKLFLDVKHYKNQASSIVFRLEGREKKTFSRLLLPTMSQIPLPQITDSEIKSILAMTEEMKQRVFGVEHIIDRLVQSALVAESESRDKTTKSPATVMAFLGKTSTGKTETAKQYARVRYGSEESMKLIDFNGVDSIQKMEELILGSKDAYGNFKPSEFIKYYEKYNDGKLVFVFDEIANARDPLTGSPKPLLKALYNIFREEEVLFADGKKRSMRNVTIILTGNTTEEIYQSIPPGLSSEMREMAMHEIFQRFLENKYLQSKLLLQDFSEALLARINNNIYFFGPLDHKPKRLLTFLKLFKSLKALKATKSKRGWNFAFATEADLIKLVEVIEKEGFSNKYQGASIDKYVKESLKDRLHAFLLKNEISTGETVYLRVLDREEVIEYQGVKRRKKVLELTLEKNSRHLYMTFDAKEAEYTVKSRSKDLVLTSYHEAGHEVVSRVLFSDTEKSSYLSIKPGITFINEQFLQYEGIKMSQKHIKVQLTKEAVLRHVAVLAAGYMGQALVSLGGKTDAGKSNDMERATQIVQNAILRYGLSKEWSMVTIPSDMSIKDYMQSYLSTKEKEKVNLITAKWLKQAEEMAMMALLLNYKTVFIPLAKALVKDAELTHKQIDDFYRDNKILTEQDSTYFTHFDEVKAWVKKLKKLVKLNAKYFKEQTKLNTYNEQSLELIYKQMYINQTVEGLKSWDTMTDNQKGLTLAILSMKVKDPRRDAFLFNETLLMPEKIANLAKMASDVKQSRVEGLMLESAKKLIVPKRCVSLLH